MTQISRPFQIALAALVLFIAVWFVALRGHSSGGESSSSPPPSAASPSSAGKSAPAQSAGGQSAPGGGTPASRGGTYHGAAPGVEGLSRAIQKARGAVAQSQQNAQQLRQKSAQASDGSQARQNSQSQQAQAQSGQAQNHGQSQQAQGKASAGASGTASHASGKPASGVPAMQAAVEAELRQDKVVAVLFWNPSGAVDATVRRELREAHGSLHGKLAVHVARSSQVGSFGSFTHAVPVYSTPTILLINHKGQTSSITGLTDVFSIEQAVKEVKRAK